MKTTSKFASTGIVAALLAIGGMAVSLPAMAVPDANYTAPGEGDGNDELAKHFQQGKALAEAELWFPAEKEFNIVLEKAPDDAMANYYMGLIKVGKDEAEAAEPYFSAAVENGEDMYLAREQLALIYISQGKTADAKAQRDAIQAMVDVCETNCAPKRNAVENVDKALAGGAAETSSLFMDQGDGAVLYGEAVAEINREHYGEAIALLKQAAADIGPHPDVLNYLGFAHRKLGLYDEAQGYYHQALAINPEHKGANEYLGELYIEIGQLDKARGQLAKLDELCPFACYEREELAHWLALAE